MKINPNCKICEGSGKVYVNKQEIDCLECKFIELERKILNMEFCKFYTIDKMKDEDKIILYNYFGKESKDRNYRIDFYKENKIMKHHIFS